MATRLVFLSGPTALEHCHANLSYSQFAFRNLWYFSRNGHNFTEKQLVVKIIIFTTRDEPEELLMSDPFSLA